MFREIGSDFWQYDLQQSSEDSRIYLPDNAEYFKSGRNAIRGLLQTLGAVPKRALLPLYICQTVIDPFLAEGWELSYYDVDSSLCPCLDSMKQAVRAHNPGLILVMHYFGFSTLSEAVAEYLHSQKQQGTVIVEDVTQSLYSRHRVPFADYTVSSLRKFFALPDGGILSSQKPRPFMKKQPADSRIDYLARSAYDGKAAYTKTMDPAQKQHFRQQFGLLHDLIAENDAPEEITPLSAQLLPGVDIARLQSSRRENCRQLLQALSHCSPITPVIKAVTEADVPLYLPIYLPDSKLRDSLRDHLISREIYCPVIWPVPEGLALQGTQAQQIYSRILCIPIDQRYSPADMQRLAEAICDFRR